MKKMTHNEAQTREPIHWEWNGYNYFLVMFGANLEDPDAFTKFLQSLKDDPPKVMAGSGFVGVVPFPWGYPGPITGQLDPLLGDWTPNPPDPATGWGRLTPDQLTERIAKIKQYIQALHVEGQLNAVMPYIDFGTQLFGRHNRPADVPESAWGFWEFYDHWEEYAEPTGAFALGPKPTDPTTWLARWYDPYGKQDVAYPDELKGLSFSYYPVKPEAYGPSYRYAVCRNTQGWALWWKQVVQWAARVGYDGVFVDNAYMTPCWNQECQEGYQQWLQENFTIEEIRRYFTTATNNLLVDPSIEAGWVQEVPGQWRASYWGSYPAQTSHIFPDTDAHSGLYSCRIEWQGGNEVAYLSHSTQPVPANKDLRLTFYYKTEGEVQATMIIQWVNLATPPPPLEKVLDPAGVWTQETVDFHTVPTTTGTVDLYLRFEVTGTGKTWLDEFWLGEVSQLPELKVELYKPSDDPVRLWAAQTYWSHVADNKLGYLREQARQENAKFELFTNGFHAINADYFMTERVMVPELDSYRQEKRKDVGFYPGVYTPGSLAPPAPVLITNGFGYKYIHSLRRPDHFGYHMPYLDPPPEHYQNPDSALLNLAETAAFGGGAGCDAAYLRQFYFIYDKVPEVKAKILEVEKRFWKFIQNRKHLYKGYRTHADVGIVFHDLTPNTPTYGRAEFVQITDLAKDLAGRGVLLDVLTENRCDAANFARLGALIYQDVSRISEAEAEAVQKYLEQGGLVIAASTVGDNDEWFRMRLPDPTRAWPPVGLPPNNSGTRPHPAAFQRHSGSGTLIYEPNPLAADQVIAALEAHLGRTVRMVANVPAEAMARLRLNAWVRKEGGAAIALHVVNYNVPLGVDKGDQVQPLTNVQVSVPLPPEFKVNRVRLHSPESAGTVQTVPFQIASGLVTFEVPSLRIYTVAVLE